MGLLLASSTRLSLPGLGTSHSRLSLWHVYLMMPLAMMESNHESLLATASFHHDIQPLAARADAQHSPLLQLDAQEAVAATSRPAAGGPLYHMNLRAGARPRLLFHRDRPRRDRCESRPRTPLPSGHYY